MNDILVVCGLGREATLVAERGIVTVAGGGDRGSLEAKLAALTGQPFSAVISFGLAGSLADDLEPGALVIPRTVRGDGGRAFPTEAVIVDTWLSALASAGTSHSVGHLAGCDAPVLTALAKREISRGTAVAVDMESHVAAAHAERCGVPFAVLRAISDPADRDLPPLAGKAMRPDGSVDVLGVIGGLARHPGQLPALLRTARDAGLAFRALRRVRGLLGPGLGLHLR